jgi:hypothetical protein
MEARRNLVPLTLRNLVPLSKEVLVAPEIAQTPRRRSDARRNERCLLDAAAAVFVTAGVEAPVRDIAARAGTPYEALVRWIDSFVDFLVTKHGLAGALRSDSTQSDALHAYFLDRLVPACTRLLDAAVRSGEIRSDVGAFALMYGVGNLCIGADTDPRYDARQLAGLLVAGLRVRD